MLGSGYLDLIDNESPEGDALHTKEISLDDLVGAVSGRLYLYLGLINEEND
jgi:hypothetical protein